MTNVQKVAAALVHLRAARELLKSAGARKSAARVRLAIASAGGAERHAALEPFRQARQAPAGSADLR